MPDPYAVTWLASWPPPISPEVEDLVHRWCLYHVRTENFDRAGVHGVDPDQRSHRRRDIAMPAPWLARQSTWFAQTTLRRLGLVSQLFKPESRRRARHEARALVEGMGWQEIVLEAGVELLPLHRGLCSTYRRG